MRHESEPILKQQPIADKRTPLEQRKDAYEDFLSWPERMRKLGLEA